ncbi:hypothetical protein [Pseudomonas sp. LAIL14HWK12:I9]|uniref:hypothetical protein n=1 Tax=Pseudomonas sp. LAIL14HWK12:I9 TaxID=1259804 RepID=UPI000487DC1E|nr:hypothetical protein [Pseudomonas sp. LAIL14HWK12:I9]
MENSGWVLLILILSPILVLGAIVCLFLRSLIYKETEKYESWKKLVLLNPDYGLAKQWLFWMAILVPVVYFVEFGFYAWKGYALDLTKDGFDEFIRSSKLPLGLLSLSIPITALVAKLHSTAQTARQIRLASRQISIVETKNNHDLFYSHRKEFVSYYDVVGELIWLDEYKTAYKIDPRIHARLFTGDASDGLPVLKREIIDTVIHNLRASEVLLSEIIKGRDLDKAHGDFVDYSREMFYLINLFGIRDLSEQIKKCCIYMPYIDVNGDMHKQCSAGTTNQQAVAIYRCVKSYLLSAVEFAGYKEGIAAIKRKEIDFIAFSGGYMNVNPDGLTIERVVARFLDDLASDGLATIKDMG